jgi:hypothetical protein
VDVGMPTDYCAFSSEKMLGEVRRHVFDAFGQWSGRVVENIIDISGDISDGYTEDTSVRY